jgi:hypothetical protein
MSVPAFFKGIFGRTMLLASCDSEIRGSKRAIRTPISPKPDPVSSFDHRAVRDLFFEFRPSCFESPRRARRGFSA